MERRERTAKGRRQDDILDKVLLWFGVSLIFELFLLAVNRYYFNYRVSEIELAAGLDQVVLPALTYAGLIGLIASIVWAVFGRKNKSKMIPTAAAFFSAAVSACCFLSREFGPASIQAIEIIVPVIAVLVLVYYLYQKEFFIITVLSGLCIFGLWLYRRAGDTHEVLCNGYLIIFAALLFVVMLGAGMLRKKEGMLEFRGKQYRILPRNASYSMILATCILTALAVAAALIIGTTPAYYAIFLLMVWIFAMAVFYTVRLM